MNPPIHTYIHTVHHTVHTYIHLSLSMSLSGVLTEYSNTPPEMRDYRKKDGVLVTVAVIAKVPHVYVCTVCMHCMYVCI